MSTKEQFILLTGIPGSGKTYVGEHLRDKHGFFFYCTDLNGLAVTNDLVTQWLSLHGKKVCLEWGFHPCDLNLVLKLREQGATVFWLKCAEDIAFRNYCEKHAENDPKGYYMIKQLERIKAAGLPQSQGSNFIIIDTYPNRKEIPREELAQKILRRLRYDK